MLTWIPLDIAKGMGYLDIMVALCNQGGRKKNGHLCAGEPEESSKGKGLAFIPVWVCFGKPKAFP